jgi:copper resistance protein D
VVTALHQAATATWLGGLFYLLIAIPRSPDNRFARQLIASFSRLALVSVAVLAAAGFTLGFAYVGSLDAIYGTSYRIMVATKAVLFGILLLLGALNFQIARSPSGGAVIASLKRFGETEIGIGITVILTAASLTSLPPAVDLRTDRVSTQEIVARLAPQLPRLASPSIEDLLEDIYAAEVKAFDAGTVSSASFVPKRGR